MLTSVSSQLQKGAIAVFVILVQGKGESNVKTQSSFAVKIILSRIFNAEIQKQLLLELSTEA
ncbi:MAG: hypothetical protein RM368_33205 [Nostoc sp. DedSLP03]|uniref:hypothetical protein n=1 Tax=Nostoc sp. DedSLP03 TaxID=3075400 RepID=UPI002AD3D70D|nr:hypothetical protein [Nostoc sp. DedSLP03]MDZ7969750.1 hypothetical protein [Nostoc sp. DedSLP03]